MVIGCSIITRGVRFFAVAYLFKRFGPTIGPVIEKRMGLAAAVGAVLIVLAGAAIYFLH